MKESTKASIKIAMKAARTICSIIIVSFVCFGAGNAVRGIMFHREALAKGVAHYNPQNGNFELGALIPQTSTSELFDKAIEPDPPKTLPPKAEAKKNLKKTNAASTGRHKV